MANRTNDLAKERNRAAAEPMMMAWTLIAPSLIGYGLAGADPLERRTVALTFSKGLTDLIPGILSYVLITVIITSLFLKWQRGQLAPSGQPSG